MKDPDKKALPEDAIKQTPEEHFKNVQSAQVNDGNPDRESKGKISKTNSTVKNVQKDDKNLQDESESFVENEYEEEFDPIKDSRLSEHGTSLSQKFKLRKARTQAITKDMTKSEKFSYYTEYYKWPVIIALALVVAIIYLAHTISLKSRPVSLAYAFLNPGNATDTKVIDDYLLDQGFDDSYQVVLDSYYVTEEEYLSAAARGATDATYLQLPELVKDDEYDFMITDAKGLDYAARNDVALPLSQCLSDLQLSNYKEYLVQAKSPEASTATDALKKVKDYGVKNSTSANELGNNTGIYALNITDTNFAKSLNTEANQVYLIICSDKEENLERTNKILDFIFQN